MKFAKLPLVALVAALALIGPATAADYVIDTAKAHASINFRIKHLGYSWLTGRFDDFSGTFTFDEAKPEASKVKVEVNTDSVNTNQAERDKHLRSKDFLDTAQVPHGDLRKHLRQAQRRQGDDHRQSHAARRDQGDRHRGGPGRRRRRTPGAATATGFPAPPASR